MQTSKIKIIGFLIGVLIAVICLPLLAIWSINVLFPAAAIAYTFINWFATFLLILIFSGSHVSKD